MKVEITGHVFGAKGQVTGTVDLPDEEAERLLNLGVAVMPGTNVTTSSDKNKSARKSGKYKETKSSGFNFFRRKR